MFFSGTILNLLLSVLKGRIYLLLVQEAGPLVPLDPKIVKFRGRRLRHISGTSRCKVEQYSVVSILIRVVFFEAEVRCRLGTVR